MSLNNTAFVPVQTQFFYTLTANGCTNPTVFSVTVTVFPTPTVPVVSPTTQFVCNGLTTTAISFSGSPVAGTVYNWTNGTTSIGLGSPGSGNIASFTAVNASNVGGVEWTNRQLAFTSIGDGLTDAEASALYTAVQAFQTTLGRQVA